MEKGKGMERGVKDNRISGSKGRACDPNSQSSSSVKAL